MNQIQIDKLFLLSDADLATQIAEARRAEKDEETRLAEAQQADASARTDWEASQDKWKAAETEFYEAREQWQRGGKRSNDVASGLIQARQILNFLNEEGRCRAAALA